MKQIIPIYFFIMDLHLTLGVLALGVGKLKCSGGGQGWQNWVCGMYFRGKKHYNGPWRKA